MPIPTTQGRVGWGAHCRVRGNLPCAARKRNLSATFATVVGVLFALWPGIAAQGQSSSARGPRVVDVRGANHGTGEAREGEGPDAAADRVDDGAPPDPAPAPVVPSATPTPPAIAGPEALGTTRVEVEALRKLAMESTELDAESKQTIERLTSEALADLERIDQFKQRAVQFQADADGVEARVAALRDQLSQLQFAQPDPPLQLGLSELEQEVSRRELELPQLKTALAKAETAPSERAGRRRVIREQLLSANQRLAELQQQLDAKPSAEEPAPITTAKRTLLTIRRRLIEAEQPALQSELAKYDAEDAADYLRLNTDVATQQVRLASAELEQLQTLLASRREADSAAALVQAEKAALAAPPELRDQANSIVEIAAAAHELAKPIDDARQLLDRTRARHEEVQRQFVTTRLRVDNIGLSGAVGPLLWRKRGDLPNLAKRRQNVSERRSLIETVQFQLYEYVDLRSESIEDTTRKMLAPVEEATEKKLHKKLKEIAPARWELLESGARQLAEQRRDRLDAVIRSQNAYLDLLFDLDGTEQLLIRETERFEQYIDERVLWVPGHRSLLTNFAIEPTDAWPLRLDKWLEVGTQLSKDLRLFPASYFFAGLLITALVWRRRKFRRQLDECGQAAARANCVRFVPTLQAAFVTTKLSLAIPGALLFLAWRLGISSDGSDFTRAVSQALYAVSWVFFPLEFLRRACRPRGLADSHFGWSPAAIAFVRSRLRWVAPVGLLFVFLTSLLGGSHAEQGVDAIERVCFVLGMTLLGTQLYRVFRPESPLLRAYLSEHPHGWSERLSHIWSWVALAAPLSFAGLTVAGYYYTAQQLTWRLNASLVFLFVLLLAQAFLKRLLLVRRRAISIQQARERAIAREQAGESGESSPQPESPPDVAANTEQTKRLIRTSLVAASMVGLWLIWVDVLPALRILDQYPLWSVDQPWAMAAPDGDGTTSAAQSLGGEAVASVSGPVATTRIGMRPKQVTIADLGLAVVIAMLTFASARNIPGVMEISILQRLPLDPSIRYAVTTLTRYSIVLLGMIFAFKAISIGWSTVQWLATALTFGLAFGVQEIFANFVAGLILLFERPLRVGDVVTVDEVTGVVSRIRIRATTITDWDRKEYVIPNKEFITGRMLNWTLSDKTNRIVVHVGIAYGSDVAKAKRLLLAICQKHEAIMDDPAPVVTFEQFGDSTLNLVVRAFLPEIDRRLPTIDDLHMEIDRQFRLEGIEIAFPQHDLHLRTVDAHAVTALQALARGQDSSGA